MIIREITCVARQTGTGEAILTRGTTKKVDLQEGDRVRCLRKPRCLGCSGKARITMASTVKSRFRLRVVGTV